MVLLGALLFLEPAIRRKHQLLLLLVFLDENLEMGGAVFFVKNHALDVLHLLGSVLGIF